MKKYVKFFAILAPVIILIIGVIIAYNMITNKQEKMMESREMAERLPVIQPIDLKPEMVNPEIANQGIGHRIGKFSFLDQNRQTITLDSVKGKIFVADYFFTTCQSICPIMSSQMERVQHKFRNNPKVKILSFTVDPKTDTVEAMKAYAELHNATPGQWHFLTGSKAKLYSLARNSFFVLKPAEAANVGDAGSDFIHTNNFVLVDKKLRIRGYYDGTDSTDIGQLMEDISYLLQQNS